MVGVGRIEELFGSMTVEERRQMTNLLIATEITGPFDVGQSGEFVECEFSLVATVRIPDNDKLRLGFSARMIEFLRANNWAFNIYDVNSKRMKYRDAAKTVEASGKSLIPIDDAIALFKFLEAEVPELAQICSSESSHRYFWASDTVANIANVAWVFGGADGWQKAYHMNTELWVRCIGPATELIQNVIHRDHSGILHSSTSFDLPAVPRD